MNNPNFYLLYGDDEAILNKEIADLKKKLQVTESDVINYDHS